MRLTRNGKGTYAFFLREASTGRINDKPKTYEPRTADHGGNERSHEIKG